MPSISSVKVETQFTRVLREICTRRATKGRLPNQAAAAKDLGLDPPRLSRILKSSMPIGARTVAIICSRLDRESAASLLQAYLTDEVAKVRQISEELSEELGCTVWREDELVRVLKKEGKGPSLGHRLGGRL